jgi:SnoaL-like domain
LHAVLHQYIFRFDGTDRGVPSWFDSEIEFRQPSETENTMSNSISTLLLRNLSDVFGENDPVRRRAALDELWNEDGVFYDPNKGVYRGRDEIDRIADAIKATHPDFKYQPLSPPEEVGDAGRVRWVSGTPGKPPAYAGTDFIVARNGRIAALYLFFDNLP